MTWERVRLAIMAGGPWPDLIETLASLDETARRESSVELEKIARSARTAEGWGEQGLFGNVPTDRFDRQSRRMARLVVAAVGCLPSAAKVEAFVRKPGIRAWLSEFPSKEFLSVATTRNPPWLADLGSRIAARITPRDISMYPTAAGLMAAGGGTLPIAAGTVTGWVEFDICPLWNNRIDMTRRLARTGSDPVMPAMVKGIFEIDAAEAAFGARAYDFENNRVLVVPQLLHDLAEAGVLDRHSLLADCLDRIVRGGADNRMQPFLAFLDLLAPTGDELAPHADDLLVITGSAGAPAAAQTFGYLVKLADAGELAADRLIEAVVSVLGRKEKGTAQKALTRLGRLVRAEPGTIDQVLPAAAVAFAHPKVAVAEAALDLVAAHLPAVQDRIVIGELELAAQGLDPTLRARAVELFGASASGSVSAAPVPVPSDPWPESIDAHDVAGWFVGRPFRGGRHSSLLSRESVVAAVVRLRHSDPGGLAAALRLALKPHEDYYYSVASWDDVNAIERLAVIASDIPGLDARSRQTSPEPAFPYRDPWEMRLAEIVNNLLVTPVSVLMATPSHQNGSLSPEVLLMRLTRAAEEDWEPWPVDLEQALLRLAIPAEVDIWAARARALGTNAGVRTAEWLDAGGMPHPLVTTTLQTLRVDHEYESWREPEVSHRLIAAVTPARDPRGPLEAALTTLEVPGGSRFRYVPAPEWTQMAPLPHHVEVLAAWELPHLVDGADYRPVDILLASDGPTGAAHGAVLCYLLTYRKEAVRVQGVDLLLAAEARGADWAPGFSSALTSLAADNSVTVSRVLTPLIDGIAGGAGGGVLRALALSLPGLLQANVRVLPDLLAMTSGLLVERGAGELSDGGARLRSVFTTQSAGRTRLAVESRRLLAALG